MKDNKEILNACALKGRPVVKVVDINRRKTLKIYAIYYVNIFAFRKLTSFDLVRVL